MKEILEAVEFVGGTFVEDAEVLGWTWRDTLGNRHIVLDYKTLHKTAPKYFPSPYVGFYPCAGWKSSMTLTEIVVAQNGRK